MAKTILPIIFILASIAGFFFYTSPQYQLAKAENEKLKSINDALKQADQLRGIRERLGEKYNAINAADLERINKMLPDSVENIGLIIELNNIARDKGMELTNPSIAENSENGSVVIGPDGKKFGSMSMTFSVTTTYEKFLDLLAELERSLRLVDVTQINFKAPEGGEKLDDKETAFTITIQTYWLKNQ